MLIINSNVQINTSNFVENTQFGVLNRMFDRMEQFCLNSVSLSRGLCTTYNILMHESMHAIGEVNGTIS